MSGAPSGSADAAAVAKVVVDIALDREFDYAIPGHLRGQVHIGSRVVVPFGRARQRGYVVGLAERSEHPQLKALEALEGCKPLLDEAMLKLARWIADYYCAPVEHAIRALLPSAVRRRGPRFKQRQVVRLADGGETAPAAAAADAPGRRRRRAAAPTPKQEAVLRVLREAGPLPLADLLARAGVKAGPVQSLRRAGRVVFADETVVRDPLANRTILPTQPLALMPEQAEALALVRQSVDTLKPPVVLLYGVTGSGKTEVYLQAIDHALRAGKGAIVLVPEIALTPQTVERFVGRFGRRVAVLHSHLSDGERHDEWHRIHDGQADIVVGARSAVFAPVRRLGLIVVDEEHEPSYKQDESPRYSARDAAVMRGHLQGCAVVLGSATPALESWRNARAGKYGLARLPRRADHRSMPAVRVVDMRLEAERTGGPNVFSRELLEAVRLRLQRGEQTILFLNRRGYATSLVCPRCGYVAACGLCSVAHTYHKSDEKLRCHLCGDVRSVPSRCPACQDPAFKYAGVGTQRVESIVHKCFPQAVAARMDADATTQRQSYDRILGEFRAGRTQILIGTQMIAKGLHFPGVTLVGVINADLSLHMPDFRAGERTFQLLAQVAGRAGRGDVSGEVIIQTYTPFNPAIQAARRVDFDGFADQELEFRRELLYPPFAHLVCVSFRGLDEGQVAGAAEALAAALRARLPESVRLAPPSPAPIARVRGLYRYQVILRSPSVRAMAGPLRAALEATRFPARVASAVDIDALSVL